MQAPARGRRDGRGRGATRTRCAPLLGDGADGVDLAAVNAPDVGGDLRSEDAVAAIADALREQGRRVHRLAVSHAFHSSLMEPMLLRVQHARQRDVRCGTDHSGRLQPDRRARRRRLRHGRLLGAPHPRGGAVRRRRARFLGSAGVTRFLEVGPGERPDRRRSSSPLDTTEPVTVSAHAQGPAGADDAARPRWPSCPCRAPTSTGSGCAAAAGWSTCRRTPSSAGVSGCPGWRRGSTRPGSAWPAPSTRCSARSSRCPRRAGWC